MGLTRKLTLQSVSTDGKNIVVKDTTGDYNADTNPSGYGTPNPDREFFVGVGIKALYLDSSVSILFTDDSADFLSGDNFTINSSQLPVPGDYPFKDGVMFLNSYAVSALKTVVGVAGNYSITGTLTDFVSADTIVTSDYIPYTIDTTKTNTADIIYLTSPLLGDITQARVGYSGGCYVMINAEFICKLVSAVGSMAQMCSEDGWSAPLGDVLVKKFEADFTFGAGDYNGAQDAIYTGLVKLNSMLNG